jgi:hypothetical protein
MRNRAEAADVIVLGFILNEFHARKRRRPAHSSKDRRRRNRGHRGPQVERRPLAISAGS